MRTLTIVLIFAFLTATSALATPSAGYMRDLTIETMLNYAKELYQRGDVQESKRVMARIKQLNVKNQEEPKEAKKKITPQASCCEISLTPAPKPIQPIVVTVDPNADIKQAIAREDQILAELNRDVDALRLQIQASNHE